MFLPFLLTLGVLPGLPVPASAVSATDLTAIPRTIAKEPTYQGTPRYCLLVFGKDAATRVWLVQDGNTVYIDRKGDGDLTAPEDKVVTERGTCFTIGRIQERDGTVHSNLLLYAPSGVGTFYLRLNVLGQRGQYVGNGQMEEPTWGSKPANAPIIHFNGPLTLARYGRVYTLSRTTTGANSRVSKLRLMLGTPGLGVGTFASYDETCSENLGPVRADIEYAPDGQGRSLKQSIDLEHEG